MKYLNLNFEVNERDFLKLRCCLLDKLSQDLKKEDKESIHKLINSLDEEYNRHI